MTAQASFHAAAPARTSHANAGRSAMARWAAVLTLLAALLGAGICMTAALPDSPIAQIQ